MFTRPIECSESCTCSDFLSGIKASSGWFVIQSRMSRHNQHFLADKHNVRQLYFLEFCSHRTSPVACFLWKACSRSSVAHVPQSSEALSFQGDRSIVGACSRLTGLRQSRWSIVAGHGPTDYCRDSIQASVGKSVVVTREKRKLVKVMCNQYTFGFHDAHSEVADYQTYLSWRPTPIEHNEQLI